MITNADITIYNLANKGTRHEKWMRTFISGVNWHGSQKATVSESGLLAANAYKVRIPLSSSPQGKYFVLPEDYDLKNNEALLGFWTLQNGDIVLRGLGDDITQPADVTEKTGCFIVTGWSDNRRGSLAVQHWLIEGK